MFGLLIAFVLGFAVCFALMWALLQQVGRNKDQRIAMFSSYFYTLDRWMKLKEKNLLLSEYLTSRGQNSVAIYGVGIMGKHLIRELQGEPFQILYAVDEGTQNTSFSFPVVKTSEITKTPDIMIVTPAYDFKQIQSHLQGKISCPIVTLEEIIKEWYNEKM